MVASCEATIAKGETLHVSVPVDADTAYVRLAVEDYATSVVLVQNWADEGGPSTSVDAEVTIPPLVRSSTPRELKRATFVQRFADATGGRIENYPGWPGIDGFDLIASAAVATSSRAGKIRHVLSPTRVVVSRDASTGSRLAKPSEHAPPRDRTARRAHRARPALRRLHS